MQKRLEQLMKSEGLSSAKLAEILSVQPSTISHLLAGRNKPNFELICKVVKMFPQLSPQWFLNGEGEMYNTVTTTGGYNCKEVDDTEAVTNDKHSNCEGFDLFTNVNAALKNNKNTCTDNLLDTTGVIEQNLENRQKLHPGNLGELSVEQENAPVQPRTSSTSSPKLLTIIMIYDDGTFKELKQQRFDY